MHGLGLQCGRAARTGDAMGPLAVDALRRKGRRDLVNPSGELRHERRQAGIGDGRRRHFLQGRAGNVVRVRPQAEAEHGAVGLGLSLIILGQPGGPAQADHKQTAREGIQGAGVAHAPDAEAATHPLHRIVARRQPVQLFRKDRGIAQPGLVQQQQTGWFTQHGRLSDPRQL